MAESAGSTAGSCDPANPATPEPTSPRAPAESAWARASQWTSLVVAGALIVCIAVIAIPYLTASGSWKAGNSIDWLLRMGGARSDQTFERYLRESSEKSQREWEERSRNSPIQKLDPGITNWKVEQFKFEPATFGKK